MKGQELLTKLRNYFKESRKLLPEITDDMLCDEGDGEKIYYMNGNDGTEFDWYVNNRLCEFMMFHKSTEYGFVKVLIYDDDTMEAYVYKEEFSFIVKPQKPEKVKLDKGDALYFATLMNIIADKEGNYDEPISKLNFDYEVTEEDIKNFNSED